MIFMLCLSYTPYKLLSSPSTHVALCSFLTHLNFHVSCSVNLSTFLQGKVTFPMLPFRKFHSLWVYYYFIKNSALVHEIGKGTEHIPNIKHNSGLPLLSPIPQSTLNGLLDSVSFQGNPSNGNRHTTSMSQNTIWIKLKRWKRAMRRNP